MNETQLPSDLVRRIMLTPTCWLWAGQISKDGYGVLTLDGRKDVYAHRATYLAAFGPVPDGLVLDHTCHDPTTCVGGRNCIHRRCVRPEHLEAVTLAQNSSRNTWAARTHCAHGHALTGSNVYESPSSGRICRACKRIASGRNRARDGGYSVPPYEVRAWARENGFDAAPRARIRLEVVRAWNDAHPDRLFTLPREQSYVLTAAEIRSWAQVNGFETIDPRGRLPRDVIDAWNAVHPENRFPGSD